MWPKECRERKKKKEKTERKKPTVCIIHSVSIKPGPQPCIFDNNLCSFINSSWPSCTGVNTSKTVTAFVLRPLLPVSKWHRLEAVMAEKDRIDVKCYTCLAVRYKPGLCAWENPHISSNQCICSGRNFYILSKHTYLTKSWIVSQLWRETLWFHLNTYKRWLGMFESSAAGNPDHKKIIYNATHMGSNI